MFDLCFADPSCVLLIIGLLLTFMLEFMRAFLELLLIPRLAGIRGSTLFMFAGCLLP